MRRSAPHPERSDPCLDGKRGDGSATDQRVAASKSDDPVDVYGKACVPYELVYPDTTLSQALHQAVGRYGSHRAVVAGDSCLSFNELWRRVNRVAAGLATMGVGPGERVLITLPNCPEFIVGFFAVQRLGAVVVNAGPLLSGEEVDRIVEMTSPRVAIALDLQAPSLEVPAGNHPKMCWLWVSLRDYQRPMKRLGYKIKQWQSRDHLAAPSCQATLEQMLEFAPAVPPTVSPSPDDLAVLQPTGGTTGTLKLARLTHRSLLANATQVGLWTRVRPGQERVVCVLPMFHVYGLTTCMLVPLINGSTVLPVTRFNTASMLRLLREHQPTVFPLVPAVLDKLSESFESKPDVEMYKLLRRCTITSGAAPLPPLTAERFEKLTGAQAIQGYGLTEASPVTHCNLLDDPRPGSIGVPLPDTRARIVLLDEPDHEAPHGEAGELLINGPQLMDGYFNNPEETAATITQDREGRRWLHTGDIATVDDDGFFCIVDRKKHMINHAGLKIWPGRVERVLREHPAVVDAAVIGRPDKVHHEVVAALIVLEAGASDIEKIKTELLDRCREQVAKYEVPKSIEFVDELPRSALGKLMKHRIKNEAAQEMPLGDLAADLALDWPADGEGALKTQDVSESE